jgi:hypothetical protein
LDSLRDVADLTSLFIQSGLAKTWLISSFQALVMWLRGQIQPEKATL